MTWILAFNTACCLVALFGVLVGTFLLGMRLGVAQGWKDCKEHNEKWDKLDQEFEVKQ